MVDGEAAAEDHPRQLHFDAPGDEEGPVVVALGRETHVGERDAAGERVVAEIGRAERQVVAGDEVTGPRQRPAARPRGVNGQQGTQCDHGSDCHRNHERAPNPNSHSIDSSVASAIPFGLVEDQKIGDMAPAFSAPGSDGKTHTLAESKGKQAVVLAWFPKAFTAG